jgi:hypothetical protein
MIMIFLAMGQICWAGDRLYDFLIREGCAGDWA